MNNNNLPIFYILKTFYNLLWQQHLFMIDLFWSLSKNSSKIIVISNFLSIRNIFAYMQTEKIFLWQVICVCVWICMCDYMNIYFLNPVYLTLFQWTHMFVKMRAWLTGFFVCFAMLRIMVSFFFTFCISLNPTTTP